MNKTSIAASVLFASIAIGSTSDAQVVRGNSGKKQAIGAWTTLAVASENRTISRMYSLPAKSGTHMYLDADIPQCTMSVSFGGKYDTPLDSDIPPTPLTAILRVDAGPVRRVQASYRGTMGDNFGFVSLRMLSDTLDPLLSEMSAGRTLRVRFEYPGEERVEAADSYSLRGFSQSLDVVLAGCLLASEQLRRDHEADTPPDPLPRQPHRRSPPSGARSL